jgi:hypothetical protein
MVAWTTRNKRFILIILLSPSLIPSHLPIPALPLIIITLHTRRSSGQLLCVCVSTNVWIILSRLTMILVRYKSECIPFYEVFSLLKSMLFHQFYFLLVFFSSKCINNNINNSNKNFYVKSKSLTFFSIYVKKNWKKKITRNNYCFQLVMTNFSLQFSV